MIEFECPNCGNSIRVPATAGKRGKCKSCQQIATVPAPTKNTEPVATQATNHASRLATISPILKFGLPILACILMYNFYVVSTHKRRHQPNPIPGEVSFTVIDQSSIRGNRNINVRLNERVSEDTLKSIASKLQAAESANTKRTFIAFYLPEMKVNAGAWATADFDPGLKIKILGVSAELERSLAQTPPNPSREKIGSWLQDKEPFPGKIVLFRENGSLYMEKTFTDGGVSKDMMIEQPSNNARRFMNAKHTRPSNDYYLIDGSGNFQIWSQDVDGSFVLVVTAKKTD